MTNDYNGVGVPIGFGMALAQNMEAMKYFAGLSFEKQKEIIDGAHGIESKTEMRSYVDGLPSRTEG